MKTAQAREAVMSSLALFTSVGTLLCCALPAALVAIGAGAALAGLVTAVPQIVFLSEHKVALFAVAGILLTASAALRYANRNAPCPTDPAIAASCTRLRRIGGMALYGSMAVYAVGFFFAFVAAELVG
jgi:hypothetical protein